MRVRTMDGRLTEADKRDAGERTLRTIYVWVAYTTIVGHILQIHPEGAANDCTNVIVCSARVCMCVCLPWIARRYKFLAFDFDETVDMTKENCRLLLIRLKMEGWMIGKTKVFLRYYNVEFLSR